jgi:hypothetical protein
MRLRGIHNPFRDRKDHRTRLDDGVSGDERSRSSEMRQSSSGNLKSPTEADGGWFAARCESDAANTSSFSLC